MNWRGRVRRGGGAVQWELRNGLPHNGAQSGQKRENSCRGFRTICGLGRLGRCFRQGTDPHSPSGHFKTFSWPSRCMETIWPRKRLNRESIPAFPCSLKQTNPETAKQKEFPTDKVFLTLFLWLVLLGLFLLFLLFSVCYQFSCLELCFLLLDTVSRNDVCSGRCFWTFKPTFFCTYSPVLVSIKVLSKQKWISINFPTVWIKTDRKILTNGKQTGFNIGFPS